MENILQMIAGQEYKMNTKTFDEFIEEQVAHANEQENYTKVDLPLRIENWRGELEKLYSDMERHLKEYIEAGKIKIQRDEITVTEPDIGSYEAEQLTLLIGTRKVVARPVGMQVIGADGRVDLSGARGSIKIVLLDKGGPMIPLTARETGQTIESKNYSALYNSDVSKKGWYITSAPPRITATVLNKDSFRAAILELADA